MCERKKTLNVRVFLKHALIFQCSELSHAKGPSWCLSAESSDQMWGFCLSPVDNSKGATCNTPRQTQWTALLFCLLCLSCVRFSVIVAGILQSIESQSNFHRISPSGCSRSIVPSCFHHQGWIRTLTFATMPEYNWFQTVFSSADKQWSLTDISKRMFALQMLRKSTRPKAVITVQHCFYKLHTSGLFNLTHSPSFGIGRKLATPVRAASRDLHPPTFHTFYRQSFLRTCDQKFNCAYILEQK